jgi:predicted branched-subunit amino acid permease
MVEIFVVSPSYIPFALVCGVASANVGMTTASALALPALVFGGSSQAVALQFMQSAASLWVAVLSGLVVNMRMAIYSAAMAPRLRHLPMWRRMVAAAFLVDNTFAFVQRREQQHPNDPYLLWYYAGISAVLWPNWVFFCGVGVLAGNIIPASWQLDFAIPLSFIAVGTMTVRSMPLLASALMGGAASVLLFDLPLKLGLIAACFVGMAAGLLAERLPGQPPVAKKGTA